MGALTSNRKRSDEHLNFNHGIPNSPYFQSSKRPRLLTSMNPSPDRPAIAMPSNRPASRLSRYPEAKPPLPRLHAPCRNLRFGSNSSRHSSSAPWKDSGAEVVRNFLDSSFFKAKSLAFGACRYFRREKEEELVELDRETEDVVVVGVSEDSSVEEIEVIEDDGGDVDKTMRDSDAKMADGGNQPSTSVDSDLSNATLKVESLSLDVDRDGTSVAVYKKLLREVEKQSPKLKQLDFEIQFYEHRRNLFQSLRPTKKKPGEVILPELFAPLTKEEEAEVNRAFSANRRKVLVAHENSNIEITGQILQCLRPGAWLNDEVINVYLELLKEREKASPKNFLRCHFFNTFFYKKLTGGNGYDYKSVRRWTSQRKLGYELINCDKIFVPVHREIHWCLAVINKKEEKFQYLDSLKGSDDRVTKVLARYYADEVKDKSGKDINLSSWKHECVEDLPEQKNGFDCGVFMIKYADFYSRGLGLCFSQAQMPYFRLRTAKEILRLRAD